MLICRDISNVTLLLLSGHDEAEKEIEREMDELQVLAELPVSHLQDISLVEEESEGSGHETACLSCLRLVGPNGETYDLYPADKAASNDPWAEVKLIT